MRSYPSTRATVSGPTTLLRRVSACALALLLILGLLLMSAANHGAVASPAGIASVTASELVPELGETGVTGSHCHCQTTVPNVIEIANVRAVTHRTFDLYDDRERGSVAADLQPEPPKV